MYSHYYDKLSQDHRQQLLVDARMQRMARCVPRQAGLARHAVGRLGAAMIAMGSRLEQIEQPGKPALRRLSAVRRPT